MWPALLEAKEKAKEITEEVERLLKKHNGLSKREISQCGGQLISETEEAEENIEDMVKELENNIQDHKKYLMNKSRFMKRHYTLKR